MKVFSGSIGGSHSLIGEDIASNSVYSPSFDNGDNGGYGFDGWSLFNEGGGGVFIGSSTPNGFGNINTSSVSFGMYSGTTAGNDGANSRRNLNRALSVGFALSGVCAVQYRNGAKGFDAYSDTGYSTSIFNVSVESDQYRIDGSNQSDVGYSSDMIISIVLKQSSTTNFDYSVNFKGTQVTNQNITKTGNKSGVVRGLKWYVYNTDGAGQSDFFFNSMKLYRY